MGYDVTAAQSLHGVAEDIPTCSLDDIFYQFWTVSFKPLPLFRAAGTLISDSFTAETVLSDSWLHIGKHWNLQKTKYVAKFYNGDRSERYPSGSEIVDEGIPFINSENIHGLCLDEINRYITIEKYKSLGGAKIKINDIIFCLRGSVGMCAINKIVDCGTVASSLVAIRTEKTYPEFMNYVFQSAIADAQTLQFQNGSCAANLSAENVGQYIFVEPTYDEQVAVCDYLNEHLHQLDAIETVKIAQLGKIKHHKSSLIFEYVTGKKRVKEAI